MKKLERPRRSVSNFDQNVFDYVLEDACVKVASVKSVKKVRQDDAPKRPQEHSACTDMFCRSWNV